MLDWKRLYFRLYLTISAIYCTLCTCTWILDFFHLAAPSRDQHSRHCWSGIVLSFLTTLLLSWLGTGTEMHWLMHSNIFEPTKPTILDCGISRRPLDAKASTRFSQYQSNSSVSLVSMNEQTCCDSLTYNYNLRCPASKETLCDQNYVNTELFILVWLVCKAFKERWIYN